MLMKLRKRLLLLGAVLTLVCFSFAACGDSDNGEKGNREEYQDENQGGNQAEDATGMADQSVELDENGIPYYDIPKVTVDENGVASWQPMIAAKEYEISFAYEMNGNAGKYVAVAVSETTTETSVQIPEGLCLMVRALYENGSFSDTAVSEYYGEAITTAAQWDAMNGIGNQDTYNPDGGATSGQPEDAVSLVSVDENGVASWEKVQGAVEYEIEYLLQNPDSMVCMLLDYTKVNQIQIPEGYALNIWAIMADGSRSNIGMTAFRGEASRSRDARFDFDVDWDNMPRWDLIANLDVDSLQTKADGSLYFEATAPNGEKMRFWAEDVTLKEGGIVFERTGRITALDPIGRIYAYQVKASEAEYATDTFCMYGGYCIDDNTHLENIDRMLATPGMSVPVSQNDYETVYNNQAYFQPNYIGFAALPFDYLSSDARNQGKFTLNELWVYYDDSSYQTPISEIAFYEYGYGWHLEGADYMVEKELPYLPEKQQMVFSLAVIPELENLNHPWSTDERRQSYANFINGSTNNLFEIGDLKDANGKVLDKQTAKVYEGTTLEITLGKYTKDVKLDVLKEFTDAKTMHDLVPNEYPETIGTLNVVVVPIGWQDEQERANAEAYAEIQSTLGRVMDANGNVTDYSDSLTINDFSLSEYFDLASYGRLNLQSYMTDWFMPPYDFAEMNYMTPHYDFSQEVNRWLHSTYPDMDWTKFDQDRNGYLDAVILVNTGDTSENLTFSPNTFGGAVCISSSYTNVYAGTPEYPNINVCVNINTGHMGDNTLIHEFGHSLGLIDYYDVTYSGIDAVGHYDMQSGNVGDWNPYSKYAVGWITPEVVTGLEKGQSVEIEIGAFATTGDAIVIPAAESEYNGTPFDEYILVDLFTDGGVNKYDAADYGLDGEVGVRIYHIDAVMESHEVKMDDPRYTEKCIVGTVHVANDYKKDGAGYYNVEVIQAGGDNTFTDVDNLSTDFDADDLFRAGDVFTVEKYSEFFYEGLMDDGSEFGYEIEVVSIDEDANGEAKAVIRITRK